MITLYNQFSPNSDDVFGLCVFFSSIIYFKGIKSIYNLYHILFINLVSIQIVHPIDAKIICAIAT